MHGYSYAVVLAKLVPSRADAILARAGDYAEQRLVCGLPYRAEIDASETLATVCAREPITNPTFKAKLGAAATELKAAGIIR
jgi:acid phosphatase (class A)